MTSGTRRNSRGRSHLRTRQMHEQHIPTQMCHCSLIPHRLEICQYRHGEDPVGGPPTGTEPSIRLRISSWRRTADRCPNQQITKQVACPDRYKGAINASKVNRLMHQRGLPYHREWMTVVEADEMGITVFTEWTWEPVEEFVRDAVDDESWSNTPSSGGSPTSTPASLRSWAQRGTARPGTDRRPQRGDAGDQGRL